MLEYDLIMCNDDFIIMKKRTYVDMEVIVKARKRQRVSKAELATRAGLSLDAIYKLERGDRMPSENTVFKLSKALDVPIENVMPELKRRRN